MKHWFKSKTIAFNGLATLFSGVTAIFYSQWVAEHPILSILILTLFGIINVWLRWLTVSPIGKDVDFVNVPPENYHYHFVELVNDSNKE